MSGLFASTGYVVQGGDIGSEIARYLAAKFDNCKGASLLLPSVFGFVSTSHNRAPFFQGFI